MSKDALVAAVKQIIQLSRTGDAEAAYDGYRELFSAPWFAANRPEDQRQALKLLILAKRSGKLGAKILAAHEAAIPALTEMVSSHNDPDDYEMLGVCHLVLGREEAAGNLFRAALTLERARNPASDLCGRLMTRVAAI